MARQIGAREEFPRGQARARPRDPGAGGLEGSAAPFARPRVRFGRPRRRSSSPSEVHPAGRPPPHRSCSSSAPPLFVQARPLLVHDSRATGPARYRLTAAVLLVLDWNPSRRRRQARSRSHRRRRLHHRFRRFHPWHRRLLHRRGRKGPGSARPRRAAARMAPSSRVSWSWPPALLRLLGAVGVPRALAGVGASGESTRRARGRGRDDAERSGGSPRVLGCHCKMVLSPRLIVLAG